MHYQDTIAAIATAAGTGAIGIIRLSGPQAIAITNSIFKGADLTQKDSHTLHFGHIIDAEQNMIDEVLVSIFKNPKSYTGEDTTEISGHGSPFILNQILQTALNAGARLAGPGEFTQRAFLNGKIDLAQAEAVADLIAADSQAAQTAALNQLRGGFSNDLKSLRNELITFAALIELELDFSDEDVEFADRSQFTILLNKLAIATQTLIDSFSLGNAIKKGISVAIIGKPNAGKSTLLNALLNEERAIVSNIAGTTRDTIEESLNINGVIFKMIDTAGIRDNTADEIESIGVGKSLEKMRQADEVIYLFDVNDTTAEQLQEQIQQFDSEGIKYVLVANKVDTIGLEVAKEQYQSLATDIIFISAKEKSAISDLKQHLFNQVITGDINTENSIVTNARHHDALLKVAECLRDIDNGMRLQISGDLLAIDIRRCLHYLGTITGQVEIDRDILGTIFGKFCIGK